MLELLWLVPAIPFASTVALAIFGSWMPRRIVAAIGAGSIAASAVISILVSYRFISTPPPGGAYVQTLFTWMFADGFRPEIALRLDALSVIMILVVTFVGFLIHLYSTEYMEESEGYSRFFAYMNLFVASMVTLVLGDNLLLLFLGWEGVGLCSYLLIGFWYTDPVNGRAAQKAFIVTRVGDTAFTIGLLLLFTNLGTLRIQELMGLAALQWPVGSALPVAAAALLLGGAVGKSAQLPLQTWLPDAMAGPTPTSALIHAATMVTAGVYLIARMSPLFLLAPVVMYAVAYVGAATMLMAGFSAFTQFEIKRVLAYSTISQIGLMFVGLGVGAWAEAIFHFMTHAFFKALLFLAAGVVIEALHHENDIFHMGGLRRRLPVAFWTFLIGGLALAGFPYITAGYYSKDLILWRTLSSGYGGFSLWGAVLAGVFLTSFYTFRLLFLVFFGEEQGRVVKRPRWAAVTPLIVLSALSLGGGFVNVPPTFAPNMRFFEDFLHTVIPPVPQVEIGPISETWSEAAAGTLIFLGIFTAWWLYVRRPGIPAALSVAPLGRTLHRFWFSDWGMDWLYDRVFVRPVEWLAQVNRGDFVDAIYNGAAALAALFWRGMSATQAGRIRLYAAGIVAGTVVLFGIVLLI